MKPKTIELLAFDRNHQLQYEGKCKLRIDRLSSLLLVEPVNEEYKMISAMFKWDFVMDQNILFVFAEHELSDFALVFDDKKRCKKVYDFIQKNKAKNDINKTMLSQRFLIPFCNKITQENDSTVELKTIFAKWINQQEREKKEKYMNLLKENNVYNFVNSEDEMEFNNNMDKSDGQKTNCNFRKRRHPETDDEEMENFRNQTPSNNFFKVIDASQFQLLNIKVASKMRRRLLIFTSPEKTTCYEYSCAPKQKLYRCIGCRAKSKKNCAIFDIANGILCIKLQDEDHACTPIPYVKEKYKEVKIIKKPGYEILENCNAIFGKLLVIFDENDKSQCWEFRAENSFFRCRQCGILASVWNKNDKTEFIELKIANHNCKLISYDRKNYYKFKDFVLSPDFEIRAIFSDDEEKKQLIIFDKNDRNFCYVYSFSKKTFRCNACYKRNSVVIAKLLRNSDGEDYVLLSKRKHICIPRLYADVCKKEKILHPPDFELIESTKNGTAKLFIFDSTDRNLCYMFSQRYDYKNKYYCYGCYVINKNSKKKDSDKVVFAKLCKDGNGQNIVLLKESKHICKPTKYEPEKYAKKETQKCYDFFFFRLTKWPKSVNVAFYHPEDKSLCFKFKAV